MIFKLIIYFIILALLFLILFFGRHVLITEYKKDKFTFYGVIIIMSITIIDIILVSIIINLIIEVLLK